MHKKLLLAASAIPLLAGTVMLTAVPAQPQSLLPWLTKTVPEPKKQRRSHSGGGTYRTLCVRACDGYYFPISFKVTRSKFKTDAIACLQRCDGGGARLFVHRNPGQGLSSAVDLRGKRYVDLENAFRYRKELVEGCGCKSAIWAENGTSGQ